MKRPHMSLSVIINASVELNHDATEIFVKQEFYHRIQNDVKVIISTLEVRCVPHELRNKVARLLKNFCFMKTKNTQQSFYIICRQCEDLLYL